MSSEYPASTPLIFALVAGAAIILGSLLPWVSVRSIFGTIIVGGTEGDGVLTLIAGAATGVLAGLALSKRNASRTTGILIVLLGIVTGLIAFNAFSAVAEAAAINDNSFVLAAVGSGLLLVILGAAMTIGSGVGVLRAAENPEEPRSSWASVGIGALVLVVLLIALAMADRWATG